MYFNVLHELFTLRISSGFFVSAVDLCLSPCEASHRLFKYSYLEPWMFSTSDPDMDVF